MIEQKVTMEHTRLLFDFYKKAYLAAIPFGVVISLIFAAHVEPTLLLSWLTILVIAALAQSQLAVRFQNTQHTGTEDSKRWARYALYGTFCFSCIIAAAALASVLLPAGEFLIANYFLVMSIVVFSACGFKIMFMAYALPLLAAFAVAGTIYFNGHWYLTLLLFIAFFLLNGISQYYENTLLESIKIRFEKLDLVQQLERQKLEAEQANRAKSVFLASASHDLRQPLHALGLYLDSIQDMLNTQAQKSLGTKMARSLEALNGLFDSILDLSKLDSGSTQPSIQNFAIKTVLTRLEDHFKPYAHSKGLLFSVAAEPIAVRSDPILLERILGNLVSNAIRYTTHGTVTIGVNSKSGRVIAEVSDSGVGIPDNEIENVFAEFYQLSNFEGNNVRGFGLGLFIVKRLCDLLDHQLTVRSKEDEGSTFSVTLPAADQGTTEKTVLSHDQTYELGGTKVVLIDDDESILKATTDVLTRSGCNVFATQSTEDALYHLGHAGFVPDIIIADYNLNSTMTGVDAIDSLTDALQSAIPCLLITGDTSPERLREATGNGHVLLHKPVNPELLRSTISHIIDQP